MVLGGGGAAGNAWLINVIAGLLDAGVDVTRAELIVGAAEDAADIRRKLGAAALASAPEHESG